MRKRFSAFLLLLSLAALFACTEPPLPVPVSVEGVSLDKTSVSILVGATKALSATIKPAEAENKAVAWLSSDAAIATVSAEGVVTGVAAGTAIITVATKEGAKTATCAVTVSAVPVADIEVTGVILDKATADVFVGAAFTLVATVAPADATDPAVVWSSSDEAIATVSDAGVVAGVKAGTATITVTTKEGAKTATCAVTVSAVPVADIEVTGVILDKTTANVFVGATATLTATVAPADATNKTVVWSSSDKAIATVSDAGVVTGVAAGTATITVATQDGDHKATCVVTVAVDTRIILVYGAEPHSVTEGLNGSTTTSYNAWKGVADPASAADGGNGEYWDSDATIYSDERPYYQFEVAPADESSGLDWQSARQACWDKTLDGGGWRLPRVSELRLIYLNMETLKEAPGFTKLTVTSYWSATESRESNAWFVQVHIGGSITHIAKTTTFRARCVREVSE